MYQLLKTAIAASIEAGKKILEVYESEFKIETKTDNSPLTEADKKSNDTIKKFLLPFSIPLISEEDKHINYQQRKNWNSFWLVDPLDGTKEFIKRNGEFTVNIALVENGSPVLGVVHVPVTGITYYGLKDYGSYRFVTHINSDKAVEKYISEATKLPDVVLPSTYTIVASRSHNTIETEIFINEKTKQFSDINIISSGSSIKLCLVAEGKANIYPRLAPTMEWDTAAGHAVAKFAGCNVFDYDTKCELIYNKESLVNPWFVVERI